MKGAGCWFIPPFRTSSPRGCGTAGGRWVGPPDLGLALALAFFPPRLDELERGVSLCGLPMRTLHFRTRRIFKRSSKAHLNKITSFYGSSCANNGKDERRGGGGARTGKGVVRRVVLSERVERALAQPDRRRGRPLEGVQPQPLQRLPQVPRGGAALEAVEERPQRRLRPKLRRRRARRICVRAGGRGG
eukprot:1186748-Prorocentrum_minimum.AAC.1